MDLVINLYEQEDFLVDNKVLIKDNLVKVKRLLSPNSDLLVKFVNKNFTSDGLVK